jgi:hypothetical protein
MSGPDKFVTVPEPHADAGALASGATGNIGNKVNRFNVLPMYPVCTSRNLTSRRALRGCAYHEVRSSCGS